MNDLPLTEKTTRTAWVQKSGATLEKVEFEPFEHACYWGAAGHTTAANTLKESETSAIPRPRFNCACGFVASARPFRSSVDFKIDPVSGHRKKPTPP